MLATAHKSYMETFSEETTKRINRRIAKLMNNELRGLVKKHKHNPVPPDVLAAIAAGIELHIFGITEARQVLASYFQE